LTASIGSVRSLLQFAGSLGFHYYIEREHLRSTIITNFGLLAAKP